MKDTIIICDFDYTIFNPGILKLAFAEALTQYGLDASVYDRGYAQAKQSSEGFYDIVHHAGLIAGAAEVRGKEMRGAIVQHWYELINLHSASAFEREDVFAFLDRLPHGYEFIVLSLGELLFQQEKIRASGILERISEAQVAITEAQDGKDIYLGRMLDTYKHVYFINDDQGQNDRLFATFSQQVGDGRLVFFEMRRPYKTIWQDRLQEIPGLHLVHSLEEVLPYLQAVTEV